MVSQRLRVCVVGAGTSGLAAIRALGRGGHEVVAFEAGSDLGGMWRYGNDSGRSAAYASLHTNTSKQRMAYPSLPMRSGVPEFPHHTDMLAYLESYADTNGLREHIKFRSVIGSARPTAGGWQVRSTEGGWRDFDALVVATGHYWHPKMPALPGTFAGTMLHARDYRAPERFAGRRVVVAGGAQSAIDIAADIATVAERTMLAADEVHHLLPREVFGRPFDRFDTPLALLMPLWLTRAASRSMMRLSGGLPDRGALPPPRHRLFEARWPTVISPAAQAALTSGAIQHRAGIASLAGGQVVFRDGRCDDADAIVVATGYHINFPFLPAELARGLGWEFPMYRRILSPHAARLAFIGVVEAGPGLLEIVERQSEWLAEALAGRLPIPDRAQMWQAIDAGGERRSRRQFSSTGQHTILCNRHAYLRVLNHDLRVSRRARDHRPKRTAR